MPDKIKLVTGNSKLLTTLGYAVSILAVAGIVSSGSQWVWQGSALFVLAVASWLVFRRSSESLYRGTGMLFPDGTAVELRSHEEVHLEFTGQAWVSSLFSVIHFLESDSGRKCSWLVCAANNHPDDYRRMLGFLRLNNNGLQEGES